MTRKFYVFECWILVRIRRLIRILGSVPLTNGSGDPDVDPGGPMHTGPVDPDPEQWYIFIIL
jgi:hypothetical protein